MTTKKIQIFYASIGSGHLIAARSISHALLDVNPDIKIEIQDIFKHSRINLLFQEIMAFIPSFLFPDLYTRIWKSGSMKKLYELSCSFGPIKGKILKNIQSFSPDLIICTHTYPCTVISNWKKHNKSPLLMAVATDQYIHPYWSIKNIDAFIAPNTPMKEELVRRGFDKEKIYPFGIPVSPRINLSVKKNKNKREMKLIVLAGSFRIAPYLIIHKRVKELLDFLVFHQSEKIIWQFVFGAAKDLKSSAQLKFPDRKDIEIYDFPENVQTMMANADFVFTKPGGLTVAEALALKKPIILLSTGAGQERENSNYVVKSGAGILLNNKESLINFTNELLQNPVGIQKKFKQTSGSLIKSAQNVAHLALGLMDGR